MPGSVILDHWGNSFPTSQEREEERLARDSLRFDRWENGLTGIGTGADKLNGQGHGRFFPTWRVLDQELSNLHSGSDLAKHAVDRRPKEMFRRGYTIESDDLTSSQTKAVREYATDVLDLDTNMREAFRWGRLYGGCLLLLDVDDGGYPWEPLDEENIRSFNSVSLIDRRYAYVQSQYSSMNGAHYGRPEIYLVSNAVAVSGWNSHEALRKKSGWELMREGGQATLVHESRTIRFDGDDADIVTRQRLAGWSWSILQKVYDAMRQFEHAFDSVGYLLADANQGVFTLQGLVKSITSGQRSAFVSRMQMMEATRSVMRGIALDAGDSQRGIPAETFERKPTSFGSIPELLQVMMLRLAAAFEEPATILFGRAPGGLNASGDNEMRSWYDQIGSDQENEIQPRAKRCYRLISLAKQGPVKGKDARFKIKFKPLWTPTDDEVAKTLLTNAQRDTIYLGTGVVKPEEVAVDLGDVYPNLDVEAREQVIEAGKSFEPYPKDRKAPPPGAGGPPGAPGAPPGAGGAGGPGKAGPMQPTSASSVNGTAGEPIGGPQVPMPLLGGGSIGGAKPATGKTPAVFGAPSALRPKGGATISPKQGANFRQTGGVRDDFDPGEERVPAGSPGGGQFAGKGGGGGGGEHEAKPAEPKQSLRERAAALVGHVKGFLGSKEVREQVVSHAVSAIKASPGKLGKAAVAKVKETYHEAKTAFAGVRVALNGGTMSPEQKHAVKTVAIHIASRVAASAIMAAIPLSVAASPLIERLSGEIARKVAEHVSEHIAHHVAEHAAKHIFSHLAGIHDAEVDPEEWLADVIEKAVAAELANLSPADLDGLASSFKGDANDAHDPKQPRGVGGRLSSHKATGMGADAYEAGDAAHESHDPDDHLTAAAAHGHAAVEYRQLAARHARLGNTAAASRHEAQAEEHQGEGTIHTELAAREAARQAGALLDDPPALSKMPAVVPPPTAQNPDVETGNDRKDWRDDPTDVRHAAIVEHRKFVADQNSAAVAVWHQLREDYPEGPIAWVLRYNWRGPEVVDLKNIDFSNAKSWAASHEPVSVAFHTLRISQGTRKPIVLVRVEGEKLYNIADGHHRGLGYKALDEAPTAYTVTVPKSEHGWQPMHDEQGAGSKQKSAQTSAQGAPIESGDSYESVFNRRYPRGAVWNADAGDWDEGKHPRGAGGQFGSGGSEGARPKAGSAVAAPAATGVMNDLIAARDLLTTAMATAPTGHFPGSKGWLEEKAAMKALDEFDRAHPDVRAAHIASRRD